MAARRRPAARPAGLDALAASRQPGGVVGRTTGIGRSGRVGRAGGVGRSVGAALLPAS
ncbi:hypothetical protein FAIPA1_340057 [Frankia sp. AiPs1]